MFLIASTTPVMAQDPVKVAPHNYKVVFENERVRVLETRVKPGEKTPTHSHPASVIYSFGSSRSKFSFADAPAMERESKPGEVRWADPVTHAEENIGTTESHALIVELKEPQPPKK
jgi:hypothetical protein